MRLAFAQQGQTANWTATGAATQLIFMRDTSLGSYQNHNTVFCCKLIYHKCATQIFTP